MAHHHQRHLPRAENIVQEMEHAMQHINRLARKHVDNDVHQREARQDDPFQGGKDSSGATIRSDEVKANAGTNT